MIGYNFIKDFIVYCVSIYNNMTIDNIINAIRELNNNQKQFEDIVYNILENLEYNNEDLASLFYLSNTKCIDMYLDMF